MHRNEQFVRTMYDAMARGDGAALAAVLTDRTSWHMPGRSALAGTYEGPTAIFGLWKRIAAETGGLRLELRDVLANDQRAVALVTVRGARKGQTIEERQVAIFEFDESGALESGTFIYEDPYAHADFFD